MKCLRALILAVVLVVLWGYGENWVLTTTHITIPHRELPQAFRGFRIAQVSDLHNQVHPWLLSALEENDPDIIAFTGDLIDSYHTDVEAALAFVREAVAIAPCYYVTGNHESRMPGFYAALKAGMEEAGVTILEGEAITLERQEESIRLLGVADSTFGETVDSQLEGLEEEGYTLLLSHRPELFDTYCSHGISLVLTGHAHGGQFRLPFLGGVLVPNQGFFPEYDAGLFTRGDTAMYISRGLGNSIFPLRLGNPPELVLITLETE